MRSLIHCVIKKGGVDFEMFFLQKVVVFKAYRTTTSLSFP